MSTTRKLNSSSKSSTLQGKFSSSFFLSSVNFLPENLQKKQAKNLDYFFLQFLLYKKNLANNKLNLKRSQLLDTEKRRFSSTQIFASQSKFLAKGSLERKFTKQFFTSHFLFLAPSNSLSTISSKEIPVALSNKAIKFALAPGQGSSSFSPGENFSQVKNPNSFLEENLRIFRSTYKRSPVLLDSHTRKPFFYYWLLPFFGFLTNVNTQESLTTSVNFSKQDCQFSCKSFSENLQRKFTLTSFGIYQRFTQTPATNLLTFQSFAQQKLENKNYPGVEFDSNSLNLVNTNSLVKLSRKNLENKSLLENLLILEKNNWQENFIQSNKFSYLPALNYLVKPSSFNNVFFVKSSVFKNNLTNKTNLPYKLSLFNTNQNFAKQNNNFATELTASLSRNVSGSASTNKLPWESKLSFAKFSNKKLDFVFSKENKGQQDFINCKFLFHKNLLDLTGVSHSSKFVQKQKFTLLLSNKKTNSITQQKLGTQLVLDFQKLNLFRSKENLGFQENLQFSFRKFTKASNFEKIFWNSNFKSALKIKKNLNLFLVNRKSNSLQNLSIKENSYTNFVFNSLFSNFENQNLLENSLNRSLSSKNLVNPQLLKKSELNYLILNSLKNTLDKVKTDNSTKILSGLEKNLQTINNLESLKFTNYFNSTTNRPIQSTNQTVFGSNKDNNLRIKIQIAEQKIAKQFVNPIFVNQALYRKFTKAFNKNLLKTNIKEQNLEHVNQAQIASVKLERKFANFGNSLSNKFYSTESAPRSGAATLSQNNTYKQNISYIESLKNQLKQNLKKQNFISKINKEELILNKKSYLCKVNLRKEDLNKTEKLVRNFLVRNKSAYNEKTRNSEFASLNTKQKFKKIKNFSSAEFGENKKAKEAIFAFFKNQLRYSLSNIKQKNNFDFSKAVWSAKPRKILLKTNRCFSKSFCKSFFGKKRFTELNFLSSEKKENLKKRFTITKVFVNNLDKTTGVSGTRASTLNKILESKNLGLVSIFSKENLENKEQNFARQSSALILKNRRFLCKFSSVNFPSKKENLQRKFTERKKASYIYKNLNLLSSKENFGKFFTKSLYEKRQKIAKKRKLKKQKKENRRRKKRKRFYPRPVWIRSRLYNFLRNKTNKTSTSFYLGKTQDNTNLFFNNKLYKSAYFSTPESKLNLNLSSNMFTTEQRQPLSIFALSNYSSTNFEKDLYTISRPVLGELKRVLWKSYWLRKNLNTYIKKIKKELKMLQEEQRKETLFETVSFIVKYLAGFDSALLNSNFGSEQKFNQLFYKPSNSAWQSAINLAEYNRLVYERMQKMIFSIRENLSTQEEMQRHIIKQLNFAHPSFKSSTKFARAKQNSSDQNLNNENKDFWLKLGKTLTFELPQSPQSFYGDTKNNRMHWALSKTYKNFREINNNNLYFSKRKNLWSTGILRDQSKANKTKKLLYNLTKNFYSGIKFVKNSNFSLSKELGLPRMDYIYLSKIRKTYKKLGYFGFSSNTKNKNKFLLKKENKKYRLLFENQSFNVLDQNLTLSIQTSNYLNFNKKVNNLAFLLKNLKLQQSNCGTSCGGAFGNNLSTNLENNLQAIPSYVNLINQYWWTFSDNNFLTTANLFRFSSLSSISKVESQSNLVVYISSFLFHFCCLISLISISQIRGIIKFGLILFSKVTNIGNQIFNLLFSVCQVFDGTFGKFFSKVPTTTSQSEISNKDLQRKFTTNLLSSKAPKNLLIKLQNSAFSLEQLSKSFFLKKRFSKNTNSELLNKILTRTRETDYKQVFKSSFQNVQLRSDKTNKLENLFFTKPNFTAAKKIYYTVYLEYLLQKNLINSNFAKRFLKENLSTQKTNLSQNSEIFKLVKKLQLLKLISVNSQKGYNSALFVYKVSNKVLEQILGTVTKTTAFFSRPGEFIGDWLAYLFLVEWSADLKTTIPDQIFQSYYLTINKLAAFFAFQNTLSLTAALRATAHNASALNLVKQNNLVKVNLLKKDLLEHKFTELLSSSGEKESLILNSSVTNFYNLNNFSSILFSFAFSKILQRRISVLFEDILEKFFQPDTDLLVRQKKSTIFWDIWGDYLVLVAEDSSINLSELTSLKEEQIKLLEILLTNSAMYSAQKSNNMFIANLTEKLGNFSFNQKENSGNAKRKVKFLDSQDLINYQKLEERMENKTSFSKHLIKNKIGEAFFNSLNNHSPIYLQNKGESQFLRNVVNNNSFYKYKVPNKLDKNNLQKKNAQLVKSKLVQKLTKKTVLTKEEKLKDFWGANQFLSYQSVVFSDLFIDLHPPKSFSNFNSIKYSDSLQHPIGSMVCQIYSGIFTRQISKNLLIVGAQGMEKSLLIQALAGETEFPLITDNAYRYSMVQQGVAVGIKLLRDVFDALALHTPCLFLLEDIHAIGERRPFLISDDQIHGADLLKNEFAKTGLDERNQIIYQLSKHVVSHFKKPYKGDFSLTIPTNQFCFEYLGNNKKGSINQTTKQNLLNSSFISYVKNQNSQKEQNNNNFEKFITNNNNKKAKTSIFASYLQLPSNQLLAPPATSPFSVLVLKESRDTKNSAVVPVKEMPWSGLPGEQYSLINKASYSVRVKVALLADMAISNLSVKLDMITDLLVIIDSVKGNRGFAVFATTHIPSILDPALRRPGRLDETILVPKSSVNLLCRWEVFKSQFSLYNVGTQNSGFSRSITIDFSTLVFNPNNNFATQNFVQNKLNLFTQFNSTSFITRKIQSTKNKNLQTNLLSKPKISLLLTEKANLLKNISLARKNKTNKENNFALANKSYKNLVSRSYFVVSEKLISSLFNSQTNNNNSQDSVLYLLNSLKDNNNIYPILYSPAKLFKDYFVNFMAGKIGEMFLSTAYYNTNSFFNISPQKNLITQSAYGIDKNWRHISDFATQLIQKRYLYNQRLFSLSNIFFTNNSSFKEPPGPPSSNVLLPARRSFNYQRNFYSQQIKRSNNLNIHEKIQLHQQQRLVKRLYSQPVQEFFFTKENNNSATSFANAPLVLGKHELILEKPGSSTWFYQKKILSRHKNYLTNQWWNAQLPEHNAETTFLSDIDWRYSFVDPGSRASAANKKQNSDKSKVQDLFIDFPDSVQYYNPRNRRWVLANNVNNLNKNTEQINNFANIFDFSEFSQETFATHFLFDAYIKAYNILNQNREILDYYASKNLTSASVESLSKFK